MSEFPEKVYVYPSMDETDFSCSKFDESSSQQEYIRSDLVPKWQPIATAPMDGTYLLTRDRNGESNVLAYIANEWCDFIHAYRSEPGPIDWMPIPKGYE